MVSVDRSKSRGSDASKTMRTIRPPSMASWLAPGGRARPALSRAVFSPANAAAASPPPRSPCSATATAWSGGATHAAQGPALARGGGGGGGADLLA